MQADFKRKTSGRQCETFSEHALVDMGHRSNAIFEPYALRFTPIPPSGVREAARDGEAVRPRVAPALHVLQELLPELRQLARERARPALRIVRRVRAQVPAEVTGCQPVCLNASRSAKTLLRGSFRRSKVD